jgi:hypothetical protein
MRFNKYWPLLSFPSTYVTQIRGITNVCVRIKPKLVAFRCLIYFCSAAKWWPLPGQVNEYRHLPNKQVEGTVWQSFSYLSNVDILAHRNLECGSISSRNIKSWFLSEIVDGRSVHAYITTCMILSRVFPLNCFVHEGCGCKNQQYLLLQAQPAMKVVAAFFPAPWSTDTTKIDRVQIRAQHYRTN